MTKIDREKDVIRNMIRIYCRRRHGGHDALCAECQALLEYANMRLDRCPQGESKTSCRKCEIHCYAPARREQIRDVMRYVGPRMIWIHPIAAIRHLIAELS